MKHYPVQVLGMELERWEHGGCKADFGVGDDWATLYHIKSQNEGKGEARAIMEAAKEHYKGKRMGGTVALHPAIKHLYQSLNYTEYD